MRKRGFFIFLISMPLWIIDALWFYELSKKAGPFAYALGSPEPSVPPLLNNIKWLALLLSLTGICISAADFASWIRRRLWRP